MCSSRSRENLRIHSSVSHLDSQVGQSVGQCDSEPEFESRCRRDFPGYSRCLTEFPIPPTNFPSMPLISHSFVFIPFMVIKKQRLNHLVGFRVMS